MSATPFRRVAVVALVVGALCGCAPRPTPETPSVSKPPDVAPRRVKLAPAERELLTRLKADLDQGFAAAIQAYDEADRKPISRLSALCADYAEQIGQRTWPRGLDAPQALAQRLREASDGIRKELQERSVTWDLGTGFAFETRAKRAELDETGGLKGWHKRIHEALEALHKQGAEF